MKFDFSMVKEFGKFYKPHKKLFTIDMVCAFFVAFIDLAYPMLAKYALNDLLPGNEFRSYFVFVLVLLGLYVLRVFFQFVNDYWGHILGIRIEYDLRKELFLHLQKLSFRFYDKTRVGHIMSRMVNDLNEMTEMAHHVPEDVFLSALMLIGSFFAMLYLNWQLALGVYTIVPIMVFFAVKRRKKMSQGFKKVKEKISGVNAQLESSISGIRVSKSFANEEHEINKFNESNVLFKNSKNEAYMQMAVFMGGMHFFINLLNIIVLGLGGFLIYNGKMNFPDLVAFTLYTNAFLVPIRRLTNSVQQFESGMTGFARFKEIMAIEPLIKDRENAVELESCKGKINFKNVTFAYNENHNIISGINLNIEPGKAIALVGPSGGGKTTLCHLIPRFYEVDSGEISIDDINIKDIKISSLRKNIGLVSQDVFLFAGTIRDNIIYGDINATEEEMIQAAKNAEIHDFIMSLEKGYDTDVGERGIKLSGGQKQRISIARVFLKNPPILILDEATSALDNETEFKIQKSLEKLSKGRTSLIIAHRLTTIKHADEIIVINKDGIQEIGTHEDLLEEKGMYRSLYDAQYKGFIPDEIEPN